MPSSTRSGIPLQTHVPKKQRKYTRKNTRLYTQINFDVRKEASPIVSISKPKGTKWDRGTTHNDLIAGIYKPLDKVVVLTRCWESCRHINYEYARYLLGVYKNIDAAVESITTNKHKPGRDSVFFSEPEYHIVTIEP